MIMYVSFVTAQTYNAAWTSDLRHVIRLISRRYANALKIGCGFSMGGFFIREWCKLWYFAMYRLNGALCISSPFNPAESSLTVEKFFPRIFFNSVLAANLKKIYFDVSFFSNTSIMFG
uniref:Uncharacterized protein n=1 Tax=Parascaris equorum TaxID=6256 RepID=A0A914R776_PAREQ